MSHPTPSPPQGSLFGQRDIQQLCAQRYRSGANH